MNRPVTTRIDPQRCIGCGSCVEVCPADTIELRGDRAVVTGTESLSCGHCAAVCPAEAIVVDALDPAATRLDMLEVSSAWLAPGDFDAAALVRLMRSRRSCRNYRNTPVARELLTDLVKIGAAAPSGTNSQRWRFAILPDRAALLALGEGVASFFRALNWITDRRLVRGLSRLTGRDELGVYHRELKPKIREALDEWARGGRERLFHGAPAAIIVSSLPGASCPAEDALLATQNILLAAHALGLGSCLVGFAVEAIRRDPRLWRLLELERGERVHAVIALGYSAEVYERTAGRLPVPIRCVTPR